MKFLVAGFFVFCLGLSAASSAETISAEQTEALNWKEAPAETQFWPIPYTLIRIYIWNGENFMKETLGLESEACEYESLKNHKKYQFSEIGACVYQHLFDSLASPEMQNPIFVWAKTEKGIRIRARIDWRPLKASTYEVINSFLEMKLEWFLEATRRPVFKWLHRDMNAIPLPSKQSLLGELTISFPSNEEIFQHLGRLAGIPIDVSSMQPHYIGVKMTPVGRLERHIAYDTDLLIENHAGKLVGRLKTNINLLKLSRRAVTKGSLKFEVGGE
jgi:hypothetical protein